MLSLTILRKLKRNMNKDNSENKILDVIRNFYMAEVLLKKINTSELVSNSILEKHLKEIKSKANKMSARDLLEYNFKNWSQRYDNYMNSHWELKEISLEDCGVWPKMGDLPDKFTHGSVIDTSNAVKDLLENRSKIKYKTSRVLYIEEMMETAKLILMYIPLIVLEDGVIRNNKLRKTSDKKLYKKCKYDIDDGNHRAVALALTGEKNVLAFVGKRIYKNKLLY